MSTRDPVVASVRIAAPPEVVFPYFTDPELVVTWIAEKAELDPRPGGVFALDVDGGQARGSFVEVDPPRRVVFTWGIPGDDELPPGSSTVEVVLVAEGARHRGDAHAPRPAGGTAPLAPGGVGAASREPGRHGRERRGGLNRRTPPERLGAGTGRRPARAGPGRHGPDRTNENVLQFLAARP